MRIRRAFIVLVACLAPPAVAAAQDARQVDIAYEITFAGISGFRIDVTARFNGSNYDVETSTFKEGMLKAVTMNYFGRNRAWGGFSQTSSTWWVRLGMKTRSSGPSPTTW